MDPFLMRVYSSTETTDAGCDAHSIETSSQQRPQLVSGLVGTYFPFPHSKISRVGNNATTNNPIIQPTLRSRNIIECTS